VKENINTLGAYRIWKVQFWNANTIELKKLGCRKTRT